MAKESGRGGRMGNARHREPGGGMSSRRWFKVKRDWYDTKSHRSLSGDALHLGPLLFYLADPSWEKDTDEAPLLDPGPGTPLTVKDIAEEARWPVRRVQRALDELCRVRTMELRDGVYVFPNYAVHQESAAAARQRRKRTADPTPEPREAPTQARSPAATVIHLPGENPARAIEREVAAQLEAHGIPHNPNDYVFKDALRAVTNRDYTVDELGQILDAYDAGAHPPGVERRKLFQLKNRAAVRRACLGAESGTWRAPADRLDNPHDLTPPDPSSAPDLTEGA